MVRQEHLITDVRECHRAEEPVRQFLLNHSEQIRLTKATGLADNPAFQSTLNDLKDALLNIEVSRYRYNHIKQPFGEFQHFFYRLTPKLKNLINRQTLLWGSWNGKQLYGFEDPTFFAVGAGYPEMTGSIISHEPLIYLYLSDEDYRWLSNENNIQWDY